MICPYLNIMMVIQMRFNNRQQTDRQPATLRLNDGGQIGGLSTASQATYLQYRESPSMLFNEISSWHGPVCIVDRRAWRVSSLHVDDSPWTRGSLTSRLSIPKLGARSVPILKTLWDSPAMEHTHSHHAWSCVCSSTSTTTTIYYVLLLLFYNWKSLIMAAK